MNMKSSVSKILTIGLSLSLLLNGCKSTASKNLSCQLSFNNDPIIGSEQIHEGVCCNCGNKFSKSTSDDKSIKDYCCENCSNSTVYKILDFAINTQEYGDELNQMKSSTEKREMPNGHNPQAIATFTRGDLLNYLKATYQEDNPLNDDDVFKNLYPEFEGNEDLKNKTIITIRAHKRDTRFNSQSGYIFRIYYKVDNKEDTLFNKKSYDDISNENPQLSTQIKIESPEFRKKGKARRNNTNKTICLGDSLSSQFTIIYHKTNKNGEEYKYTIKKSFDIKLESLKKRMNNTNFNNTLDRELQNPSFYMSTYGSGDINWFSPIIQYESENKMCEEDINCNLNDKIKELKNYQNNSHFGIPDCCFSEDTRSTCFDSLKKVNLEKLEEVKEDLELQEHEEDKENPEVKEIKEDSEVQEFEEDKEKPEDIISSENSEVKETIEG